MQLKLVKRIFIWCIPQDTSSKDLEACIPLSFIVKFLRINSSGKIDGKLKFLLSNDRKILKLLGDLQLTENEHHWMTRSNSMPTILTSRYLIFLNLCIYLSMKFSDWFLGLNLVACTYISLLQQDTKAEYVWRCLLRIYNKEKSGTLYTLKTWETAVGSSSE